MSKRSIAIIAAVVGAALIVLLYVLIVRSIQTQQVQQAALMEQIEPLETALAAQQRGSDVLPTRRAELDALQAQLAEAQFAFPSEVDSTQVLSYVIGSAEESGVHLRQLEARAPTTVALSIGPYRLFTYDVTVEGGPQATAAFLAALERKAVATMALDQIHMQWQPTPQVYRTTLTVLVYARPRSEGGRPGE